MSPLLKITVIEEPGQQRWLVEGQLVGDSATELGANWMLSLDGSKQRRRVVDLSGVTMIDGCGEEVLLRMMGQQDARFVARGIYTAHLLESLRRRRGQDA